MKTFTIDAQTMHYQDIGEGPVLVFGHSYLWDSTMWAPQVEVLSQSYRCIVPEFWGHGASAPAPESTRSLKDYANDVLSLLDDLGIETFSLVGLSSGGMWATELAIKAPARVKSLVLMDTFVGLEPEVVHTKYFAKLAEIEEKKALSPDIVNFFDERQFSVLGKNDPVRAAFRQRLLDADKDRALALAKAGRMVFGRRDMFEDAEMLALPTLIMVGAQDSMRPVLESQLMHDGITGSEFVLIPNAGHISNLEQADFVTGKLQRFFAGCVSR
ncbi:2-succinyl-6-hydroxy-2,4-cyclohexadiene-1-carboxylate synthase [Photobacterium gaetbulicola]|uniref:Hydrolase or acyltransferase n=1 Tax=Photobacterium gaetbulicola Gung47 TaxID=658445 RepID=A0A0C5WS57_9GAMM|nr:alpha/beta fold hydrolase [Photobacterium gaetbulicola]AJR05795.1 hydrolase or acyltransferase [Photobacterium gaetbulicola Gung47]PSU14759.1 2-succinyl-6-hydroxy-2,4-cyclohexadiene-1-carboxylate synthase [Photobacterium gaetbulicola]